MFSFRLLLSVFLCSLLAPALWAQDSATKAALWAQQISPQSIEKHLRIIAADDMEGRETGEPGQKKAAAYVAGQLATMGFPAIGEQGGYFQTILFKRQKWSRIEMSNQGVEQRHLRDFYSLPDENDSRSETAINELIFLGYGIEDPAYNDYAKAGDLKGKHILIFGGEARHADGKFQISGTNEPSIWSYAMEQKLAIAKQKGVATVFVIDPDFRNQLGNARKISLDGRNQMASVKESDRPTANTVYISSELAKNLLGKAYKKLIKSRKKLEKSGTLTPFGIPVAITLTQEKQVNELVGENIFGFVEGSDPSKKEEIVVFSAHYDHIGRKGDVIFNGADDNGSGTSSLLSIAETVMKAKIAGEGSARSILFVWVSGEEKGLLGSDYYVNHPLFPLDKTVVDINVDMVGRVDEKYAENPYYIYVIGSDRLSTALHQINEAMNKQYTQLVLDYTYNAESDPNRYYYRSDHYNFAKKGIPSIFYFNGTHEDYHQAGDTVDKIHFDKMAKVAQLIFHTGWEIANRAERIKVDVGR